MGVFKSNLGITGSSKGPTTASFQAPRTRIGSAEKIVRPFELVSVLAADQPPQVDADPEAETEVRFGKASQFSYSVDNPDDQLDSGGIEIRDNDADPQEDDQQPSGALIYREVRRAAFPIRIENPDDPDQYVIVSRIYAIVFDGPDGRQRTFILDHPA